MLNRNQNVHGYTEGRLPASAPLANPYVPFQLNSPAVYQTRKAFVRGTLYPGLDLPFMGMVNQSEKPVTPMTELQSIAFAVQELALYLDTHSCDTEALELYRQYQQQYKKCLEQYEEKFGPISHRSISRGEYRWLDDPWPWEYAKNREV